MNKNPKYNVTFFIEDTLSSKLWHEEIELLKEKFNNNSEFNEIKNYTYKEKDKKLQIEGNNIDSIISNNKTTESNLVFIVSDTCSRIWHNNKMSNFINEIQNNCLVSIINLLPKSMWSNLPIDTTNKIKTSIPSNIKNNLEIEKVLPSYSKTKLEDIILCPTSTIDRIEELINNIVNGGEVSSVKLYKNIQEKIFENEKSTEPKTATQIINSFKNRFSQESCILAVYMSVIDSFTISDVEFLRKHMLPQSDKSATAQFFLGDLLNKADSIENNDIVEYEDIEQRYKFKEAVSEELRRGLRYIEADTIKILMKEKKLQDLNMDYDWEKTEINKLKM